MSYRKQKDVIASITARKHTRNGTEYNVYEVFLGRDPLTKKQKRLYSMSKTQLKSYIADFYAKLEAGGSIAVTFTHLQAADARTAFDLLEHHKSTLSLTDCVRRVLDAPAEVDTCTKTVSDAVQAFMVAKGGKSQDYLKTLKGHLGKWAQNFGPNRMLSEITAAEVKDDLMARLYDEDDQKTWKTYNNHLGDIMTFTAWCAKPEQAYITRNPLAGMSKITIPYRTPDYVRAEDIGKLLVTIWNHRQESPADLADAVLSFFCGLRQCEIARVRDGESAVRVSLEDRFIRVVKCKGATRGIRPRAFEIPEPAFTWMKSFDFMSALQISNNQFRRHLVDYAAEAKVKLPANAGRHTFITMYAAAYHDQKKLTEISGNTEGVRANSYDGVESERNGKAYFAITPQSLAILPAKDNANLVSTKKE